MTLPHEKQIHEYEETIRKFREKKEGPKLLSPSEVQKLEKKLERLKKKVYSELGPVERLAIARHHERPRALDYINELCEEFIEFHGDRCFRDDASIVGGLGKICGQRFMIIGQEKGSDTDSRLHRNFGMAHPEGFRKALRLMAMAEKFGLPLLTLVDTPGAFPGLAAEERGQAWAIAENLFGMARLKTPIIVVVIGEAGSGGALAIAVGDRTGMLEHSYYSVISPEGCASILWKDASKKDLAVAALKLNSEHMLECGVIDKVLKEPLGGAHHDPKQTIREVEKFVMKSLRELEAIAPDLLIAQRYEKYRKLGSHEE